MTGLPPLEDVLEDGDAPTVPAPESPREEPKPLPAVKNAPFRPPHTHVGEAVHYWRDGNPQGVPTVAFVTSVNNDGDGNITATSLSRGGVYLAPIEYTILHKDDPRLIENPDLAKGGVWDISLRVEAIHRLMKDVSELRSRVSKLEG